VSSNRETFINPNCQNHKLRIQRTVWRYPRGILLGQPIVKHQIKKCPLCKREYPCEYLHHLIPPHGNYAYDIIIYVGMARFRHHRQNHEIQEQLQHRFKLFIPESTINALTHQFLDYFSAVHYAKGNDIAQLIKKNGGYVAHFDGTCDAGTEVLFSVIDEISRIVLLTTRMTSENFNEVKQFFTKCKNLYDHPLAIMRDLGTNYQPAIKEVFDQVVDLICQYHFLENVGSSLLKKTHQELTNIIRNLKIKTSFKAIRKKMVQAARNKPSTSISITSKQLEQFIKNPDIMLNLDKKILQKYLIYFILRWIDDYSSELKGEYFPFDQPALVYYRRCVQVYDLITQLLDNSSQLKTRQKQTLQTIVRNLEPLKNDHNLHKVANRLEKQVNLFNQLRDTLRFNRPDKKPILRQTPLLSNIEEVKKTEERLKQFRQDLQRNINTEKKEKGNDIDVDIKCASKKIIDYLDKYMDELVGHLVTIPGKNGKNKVTLLDRTNNLSEQHFSNTKKGWRRKLGVKKLTRHLKAARHEELLLTNLDQPEYINIVYDGNPDNMPSLFAKNCHQARQIRKLRDGKEEKRALPIGKKFLRTSGVLTEVVAALKTVLYSYEKRVA